MFKSKLLNTLILTALSAPGLALAEDAPVSPHIFTANVALVSDYTFRGVSQTFRQPAIQGGIDYGHSSGIYLGVWSSNVSNVSYLGGSQEIDFYGGYKGKVNDDLNYDIGLLEYYYPNAVTAPAPAASNKYNTLEAYGAVNYKFVGAKYSYSLTDFFGANTLTGATGSTKGSGYLDLYANYEVAPKLTLVAHAGHQSVSNGGSIFLGYSDYKLGVTKDINGYVLGVAYIKTNLPTAATTYTNANSGTTKNIGDGAVVWSVTRAF
jgi:uncharacterized protein (TIGR02001 family)